MGPKTRYPVGSTAIRIPVCPTVEQPRNAVPLRAELEQVSDERERGRSGRMLGIVLVLLVEIGGQQRRAAGHGDHNRQVVFQAGHDLCTTPPSSSSS